MEYLSKLTTEQRNDRTINIDRVTTLEMLEMINDEDAKAAAAVRAELPNVARAVDAAAAAIEAGGRLYYVGAGTSGRLGVLDASEILPTFGETCVEGIMAGGKDALFVAKEGAEDSAALGASDMSERGVGAKDVVVGITASGRTPYVLGAIEAARARGAITVGLSNSAGAKLAEICHIAITPVAGPEALTGSTRMKAGTMQKMVLNMISTGAMIRLGKVYGNLMVDLVPTNEKLTDRSRRIVAEAAGVSADQAAAALEKTNNAKTAIVMLKTGLNADDAAQILKRHGGFIAKALEAPR